MANLIEASGDVFSALMHGRPTVNNRRFLSTQLNNASHVIGEHSRKFMDRAKSMFDSFDLDSIDRSLRAIKNKFDYRWQDHDVRQLSSVEDFQQAALRMQRWMMANPMARKLYHKERCHGWRDTYVDFEPGVWGERHTDWMKVNNGLAVTDEEGNTSFTTYFDAFDEEGKEELTFSEQQDILQSWNYLEHYLRLGGDDPTSPSNGSL